MHAPVRSCDSGLPYEETPGLCQWTTLTEETPGYMRQWATREKIPACDSRLPRKEEPGHQIRTTRNLSRQFSNLYATAEASRLHLQRHKKLSPRTAIRQHDNKNNTTFQKPGIRSKHQKYSWISSLLWALLPHF